MSQSWICSRDRIGGMQSIDMTFLERFVAAKWVSHSVDELVTLGNQNPRLRRRGYHLSLAFNMLYTPVNQTDYSIKITLSVPFDYRGDVPLQVRYTDAPTVGTFLAKFVAHPVKNSYCVLSPDGNSDRNARGGDTELFVHLKKGRQYSRGLDQGSSLLLKLVEPLLKEWTKGMIESSMVAIARHGLQESRSSSMAAVRTSATASA